MIDTLKNIDQNIFLLINGFYSDFADMFFVFISNKFAWIPFYIILLYFSIMEMKKKWWLLFLFVPLLVLATDQISVHLFKNIFLRYRPCHNLNIREIVHMVNNHCGGKYGFISSHAANSFGIATFIWLVLRKNSKIWFWILFVGYAFLVSYSRIYLGVHYPADIAVGALVGISLGAIFYYFMHFLDNIIFNRKAAH